MSSLRDLHAPDFDRAVSHALGLCDGEPIPDQLISIFTPRAESIIVVQPYFLGLRRANA
jgi:hypothetical protein